MVSLGEILFLIEILPFKLQSTNESITAQVQKNTKAQRMKERTYIYESFNAMEGSGKAPSADSSVWKWRHATLVTITHTLKPVGNGIENSLPVAQDMELQMVFNFDYSRIVNGLNMPRYHKTQTVRSLHSSIGYECPSMSRANIIE